MSFPRPTLAASLVLGLVTLVSVPSAALAQDKTKADELHERGDYLFKSGYYFRASDNYRLALVEDPTNPWRKLAFGHSLFAIGKYGYASYALRRGVAELDPKLTFAPEIAPLFPSRRRFQQALRDLKRYVTYSPRDAAGLTVLGYVLYSIRGEERRSRDMFRYLLRLDPNDAFATSMIAQLDRRAKTAAEAGERKDGHPVKLLLKGFDTETFEEVRNALRSHPGVSGIEDSEALDQITISFLYAGPNLDTNLRNLLASLGITATLREQATSDRQLRSFLVEIKEKEPKEPPKVEPKPVAKPEAKGPLKERVPVSKRERERLENEWPSPTPAKAK